MRDMLGGFPVRDLDFTVEGNALKLAKALAEKPGVRIVSHGREPRSRGAGLPGRRDGGDRHVAAGTLRARPGPGRR